MSNTTALQLRSLVKKTGELELSLASVPIPEPGPDEVLVRIEASPLNPSDLALLFGGADMTAAKVSGTADRPVVTAPIPERMIRAMAARFGKSTPCIIPKPLSKYTKSSVATLPDAPAA